MNEIPTMRKIAVLLFLALTQVSYADLTTCKNLYIGRLDLYKDQGLNKFTLVEDISQKNGSQWISVANWDDESKKMITSILLSAKISQSMVLVETTHPSNSGSCNIKTETGRQLHRLIVQQGTY